MDKKAKKLMKLSKKIMQKKTYQDLNKIKNSGELTQALKYAVVSSLERELSTLSKEIENLERDDKDTFFLRTKSLSIPGKIKSFEAHFNEEELIKALKSIKEAKEEINVQN